MLITLIRRTSKSVAIRLIIWRIFHRKLTSIFVTFTLNDAQIQMAKNQMFLNYFGKQEFTTNFSLLLTIASCTMITKSIWMIWAKLVASPKMVSLFTNRKNLVLSFRKQNSISLQRKFVIIESKHRDPFKLQFFRYNFIEMCFFFIEISWILWIFIWRTCMRGIAESLSSYRRWRWWHLRDVFSGNICSEGQRK